MQTENEALACQSVYLLHQWIETVFTQPRSEAVLQQLLASFHPAFTMVTTAGNTVTLDAVQALFHQHAGSREGLRIEIDACTVLATTPDSVLCRYRETHHQAGIAQARWSVALIEVVQQQARWRFLQETAIA